MGDLRQIQFDRIRKLALHPLHMIDVVLQEQIRGADLAHDLERLSRMRKKKAGDIVGIDRLDQKSDAFAAQRFGGEAEIPDEGCANPFAKIDRSINLRAKSSPLKGAIIAMAPQ